MSFGVSGFVQLDLLLKGDRGRRTAVHFLPYSGIHFEVWINRIASIVCVCLQSWCGGQCVLCLNCDTLLDFSLFLLFFSASSGPLLSDQNPSEMDALCPSPPGPSRPQRNYERIGERTGTS